MSQRSVKSAPRSGFVSDVHSGWTEGLGTTLVGAYAQQNIGLFSRRTTSFVFVLCLHAAVLYVLMTALSHTRSSVVPPPLQNRPLRQTDTRQLPPLPAPQKWNAPTLQVPLPEIAVEPEVHKGEEPSQVIYETPPSLRPPASPAQAVKLVQGGPGAGFPNPDDFYPMLARRMEEQGIATVRVCVDVNGRLIADPTTLMSTGSPRLDEGAVALARAGSGHYRATTEDGRPVSACYPFRIRFQLKN